MEQKEISLAEVLLKSSSIIFILTFIIKIFGYLFNSLLTKTITHVDYGSYTFAWSIAMFASGILLLGINPAIARFVAYHRGKGGAEEVSSAIKTGLTMVLFLTFFSLVLIFGINKLFPQLLSIDKPLILFMLAVFATHGIGFFFICAISGYRKPEIGTIFSTLFTILSFCFVLIAAYFGYGFIPILLAIFAAFLISNIGGAIYVLKYFGIGGRFNFHLSKELILFGIPLVLIDSANNLLSWANIYILKIFYGFAEVGVFTAAIITSNIMLLFSQPIIAIFSPVVAEMYGKKDFEKLAFISSYLFERVLLFSSPVLIALLVFPEGILKIIFTENYALAAIPLQILSVSVLFLAISMIFRTVITASGKPQQEARIILIAAVINVALNFLLVKPYGIIGASIATFISSLFILAFSFRYSRRTTKILVYKDRLIKIGLSLFTSLAFVYVVKLTILNLYLAFAVSLTILAISYTLLLIALKALRAEDAVMFKMIMDMLPFLKKFEAPILSMLKKGIS